MLVNNSTSWLAGSNSWFDSASTAQVLGGLVETYSRSDDYSFGGRLCTLGLTASVDLSAALVGVLFARPEFDVVSKEILASLRYFDARSSNCAWFFFAGYKSRAELDGVYDDDGETGFWRSHSLYPATKFNRVSKETDWYFSPEEFNKIRGRFQDESEWAYKGGVELLLVNMKRAVPSAEDEWFFDFSTTLLLRLDNLKDSKIADGVGILFEKIFQYSEAVEPDDPVGGLSDYLGLRTTGDSVIKSLLALLPYELGAEFRKVASLAVRDMRKKR